MIIVYVAILVSRVMEVLVFGIEFSADATNITILFMLNFFTYLYLGCASIVENYPDFVSHYYGLSDWRCEKLHTSDSTR